MYLRINVQATSNERPRITITDTEREREITRDDNLAPSDLLALAGVVDNLLPLEPDGRNSQGDGPVTSFVRAGLLKTMHSASQDASGLVESSADKLKLARDIASAVGA
jgi:hypothetical protein